MDDQCIMCFPFYRGWTSDTYRTVVHVDVIFAVTNHLSDLFVLGG